MANKFHVEGMRPLNAPGNTGFNIPGARPLGTSSPQADQGSGRHIARTAKDIGAGVVGAIPDFASAFYNLPALGANYAFDANLPLIPSATDAISRSVDNLTGGYTAPQNDAERIASAGVQAVATIPGVGQVGKAANLAGKAPKIAEFLRKGGTLNKANVATAAGAGAGAEALSDEGPGGALLGAIAGGYGAGRAVKSGESLVRTLAGRGPEKSLTKQLKNFGQTANLEEIEHLKNLEKKTGIDLTAGELTGKRSLMSTEDTLANSGRTEAFELNNKKRLEQIETKFNRMLDKLSPNDTTDYNFGEKLTKTFDRTIEQVLDHRQKQAKADFALVDKMSKGKPIIKLDKFTDTLTEIIAENSAPTASPQQEKIAKETNKWLKKVGNRSVSGQDAQLALKELGQQAKGSGSIFKEIDSASGKRYSRMLFGAMMDDVEIAAQSSKDINQATALKAARANYKANSAALDEIENTALGKLLGTGKVQSAEEISSKFLSMDPSEVKAAIGILSKADPAVVKDVQRYYIQNALDKAVEGKGFLEGDFKSNRFLNSLPDKKTFNSVFGGDPKAYEEIKDLATILGRIDKNSAKAGGSQTAQRLFAADNNKLPDSKWKAVKMLGDYIKSKFINEEKLAEVLIDKRLRDRLLKGAFNEKDVLSLSSSAALSAGRATATQIGAE
jgi:hypothetical protein